MTLLLRTCSAEWTRLWSVRTTWWFGGIFVALLVVVGTLLGFESAADPPEVQGDPAWRTAQYLLMPGQFALLGLVITAVTADYATGGIVPTLQWTPRRTPLFLARLLVPGVTAVVLGVCTAVAAAVLAFATSGSGLTLHAGDGVSMVGTVGFVVLTEVALGIGLGFLLRNTAGALVSGFLLVLVLPLLLPALGDWMNTVSELLPGSGVIGLLLGDVPGMSTTKSVTVLLVWAIAVPFLGWQRLLRDDANR